MAAAWWSEIWFLGNMYWLVWGTVPLPLAEDAILPGSSKAGEEDSPGSPAKRVDRD